MSKVQDFFTAAPKTVLNKPFMHVQERHASGTDLASVALTTYERELNHVVTNSISGASLASNEVTLPAGKYYIEASTTSYGIGGSKGKVLGGSGGSLIDGISSFSQESYGGVDRTWVIGEITLNSTDTLTISQWIEKAETSGRGRGTGSGDDEIFSEMRIWKLDSNIETPVLSDPTMVAARPLMHVQDQKTTGTHGGTSISGFQQRTLNTVLTSDISGASLSSNSVTLPAGTYHVHASVPMGGGSQPAFVAVRKSSDNSIVLKGFAQNTGYNAYLEASGKVVLSVSDSLYIDHYAAYAGANALGIAASQAPYEVYSDLKIWQLDALRQTPVIVNDKLYPLPGSTYVTGNMHGLEYAYTSANSITIQPGICMDSTNNVVLDLPSAQVLSIPTAINTIYNLFLCNDNVVRTDTDVDGANLGAYTSIRWIGFVRTDGSGDVIAFYNDGDLIKWMTPIVIGSALGTSYSSLDITSFIPVNRDSCQQSI